MTVFLPLITRILFITGWIIVVRKFYSSYRCLYAYIYFKTLQIVHPVKFFLTKILNHRINVRCYRQIGEWAFYLRSSISRSMVLGVVVRLFLIKLICPVCQQLLVLFWGFGPDPPLQNNSCQKPSFSLTAQTCAVT